ncbi:MAG: NAD(P)/FAD-dependent oxidoreductase [Candidatus Thermoplasmatota archaeon]|jgi:flavin-dependent dehydrogenase|nr:NAD(P)/FAD-dependent oxidoreductase [Candidatus Thermoplasmatota archaeon]
MSGKSDYDVIVAGAGLAGMTSAAMAARDGASVLLVDRNDEINVGKKTVWGWACGDAVAASHIAFLEKHTGVKFDKPELDLRVDGVLALSPDLEARYPFEGDGYSLDRPAFERKLLKIAKGYKIDYMHNFDVSAPIIENGFVTGIKGKDMDGKETSFKSKIVIDTLGVSTVIRRNLPENPFVDRMVDIDDIESTGRYIYSFELERPDERYYDPKYALIHLNNDLAPGGYGWVFPKSGNRVNIGLGVQKRSLDIRNKKMGKNDNLQKLIDEYVKWVPIFKNLKVDTTDGNGKGIWSVPVRRQMESLVFNGYMGAGDSMTMPNPISAGGIGPALIAGILAGKVAASAVKNGDVSVAGLWKYNLDFNEAYGSKMAGMEAFRIYLQSLSNDILNYGMRNFLTRKEASDLTVGMIPELSLSQKAKMVLKGMKNINAFGNLVFTVKKMKEFNEIYSNYPKSPKEFEPFKKKVVHEIEAIKERFPPASAE